MQGRDVFAAGIRVLGVYFIVESSYSLLIIILRDQYYPTDARFASITDWTAGAWRLGVGILLIAGVRFIAEAIYGPILPPDEDVED